VVAYVQAIISPPKRFARNQPALVVPESEGILRLSSTNCEIRGKTLIFEERYSNLGFWQSTDDRAVWTIEVPRSGQYEVTFDYACADETARRQFQLETSDKKLTGLVESTGTFDNYQQRVYGKMPLAAGKQRICLSPAPGFRGALLDLKEIRLKPVAD